MMGVIHGSNLRWSLELLLLALVTTCGLELLGMAILSFWLVLYLSDESQSMLWWLSSYIGSEGG